MGTMKMNDAVATRENEILRAILSDVRTGNDAAFARLVARYEGLLRTQAARFGAESGETEDAYQEACLALHRAALHYKPCESVTFGLFAKICITNALKNRFVRVKGPDLVPFDEQSFLARFSDPMVEEERLKELLGVIHRELSSYEAQVFDLHAEGLSFADIAARIGEEEKSVRNAYSRAIGKLRKKLDR